MIITRLYHLILRLIGRRLYAVAAVCWLFPALVHATTPNSYADYHIALNSGLNELQVELCFSDQVPEALVANSAIAQRALKELRINGESVPAKRTRGKIYLHDLEPQGCLQYRVDLDVARADVNLPRIGRYRRQDILVDAASWLWLPEVDMDEKRIILSFDLPAGINVSAPWPQLDEQHSTHSFVLGPSPDDGECLIAFGRFEIDNIRVRNATLRLAVLGNLPEPKRHNVRRWVEHGANSLINIYGRFPLSSPQILVVPVGAYNEPVPWGQVLRTGGSSMQLFIDTSRPYDEFIQDWTLVHELSHFLHPMLEMGSAWLSEGMASYYQNVVQARAGTITAQHAWQKLYNGFQRGIGQTHRDRSLDWESRNMRNTHRYMRVYWSGAAIALLADVALREQGQSLDQVMASFQDCCLRDEMYWRTDDFINKLDSLSGSSVFSDLQARYVYSDQFPDLEDAYDQLGLRINNGQVFLDDAGESPLAQQIMSAY